MVPSDFDKAKKFEWGLIHKLKTQVSIFQLPTYTTVLNVALIVEEAVKSWVRQSGKGPGGGQSQGQGSSKRLSPDGSSSSDVGQHIVPPNSTLSL